MSDSMLESPVIGRFACAAHSLADRGGGASRAFRASASLAPSSASSRHRASHCWGLGRSNRSEPTFVKQERRASPGVRSQAASCGTPRQLSHACDFLLARGRMLRCHAATGGKGRCSRAFCLDLRSAAAYIDRFRVSGKSARGSRPCQVHWAS